MTGSLCDTIEAWEDAQSHQDTVYYYGAAKHPYAVTKTVYPDSGEVTVTYNDDGTVATRTDQRGWEVEYTYDDARRVTQEDVSGTGLVGTTQVTYAYDALGRPTSATDNNDPNDGNDNATVEWTYTREADGDLEVEETQEYGQATDRTVASTYDLPGRLKTLAYPSGMSLTYSYDDLGRVTAVNDGTNDRVADTYKGHLLEKRTYASGAYLTHLDDQGGNLSGYGYDSFGRLKNHRHKSSGGTLLAGWQHDYDRIGNKRYQEDQQSAAGSELYGYDSVYRLTSFKRGQLNEAKTDITNPTRTQTWSLDPLGNWDDTDVDSVTESRVHDSVNELTARTVNGDPQISLSYDDAGNLTQDGSSDGNHKYTWDYRNRLLTAQEKQSGDWVTVGTYKYDAQGRRLRKAVTNNGGLNGTTRFIWGGDSDWQCLEERDGNDALVARFTYSPGYIDAVAVQERDLNADSDFGDTNEVVYYHQNALFSVYALSDGNGSVIEKYRFDAYGGCTVLDADGSVDADGLSDVKNPYTFTGRRLDSESGLMQYRNRCYSATLGRFTSREPQGYGEGLNLFAYVGGGPTVRLDPTGERTWTVEVGNPGLPHFFEMAPGVPAVITGTIWEVYGNKGQVIFRQGRAGAQKAPARCQGRTVTIKFYYRVASLKVDEVVKAQVDRILQQCVNRCVAKCPDGSNKHKVELAWEETAMSWEDWADSDERGKHGGNFFGFNATEWNLYFEERQGRKIMLGQTPSLWFPREFVVFRRGIENRVTVQGHKVSNVLATTIAHEGFNHCIAGNWGHPGGMGQEYIDSAEGNTTGQAVLSDPACKELCDEMDIN